MRASESAAHVRSAIAQLTLGSRLAARLPRLLRRRVTPVEARATVQRRLAQRESDFLDLAARAIYAIPDSPYRELLRLAGCEYTDLQRLVRAEGLEGALQALHAAGVFLTVDEFKGRRAAIRGGATMHVDPGWLRNPLVQGLVEGRTSGSRGTGTPVLIALEFVRDCAADALLALEARGGLAWRKAVWEAPGAGATFRLLKYSSFGAPAAAWFSSVELGAPGLHRRYRWGERLLRWEARLLGVPLPRVRSAPLDDPLPVARWLADTLLEGAVPHLFTLSSPAVRMCRAASDAGLDLRGARIVLGGEPVTAARVRAVRATGAEPIPRYGSVECGPIGYACMRPHAPDDVHVLSDLHAVIEAASASRTPAGALFVTSLRPTAPLILLNVSMGDRAELTQRPCGCPLEDLGWRTHLTRIRSFEKLTGEGITLLDTDVVRILEEVLPARFGGAPTHYQLVEEEAAGGTSRVRLLVDPAVGPLDPTAVADAFLDALGWGAGGEWIMARLWRDAGTLRVERREPIATRSGKIHHLVAGAAEAGCSTRS
ncbi:MAG: hypothetical protein ABR599_00065 [Gemmatimonadota bacterium]